MGLPVCPNNYFLSSFLVTIFKIKMTNLKEGKNVMIINKHRFCDNAQTDTHYELQQLKSVS